MYRNLIKSLVIKSFVITVCFCDVWCTAHSQTNATNKTDSTCHLDSLPSIRFAENHPTLSEENKKLLNSAIKKISANPNCRVFIVSNGAYSYRGQQESWDRAYTVLMYLRKNGVPANQLIFDYGERGDTYTVSLTSTIEYGPPVVVPPHPNYSRFKNLPTDKILAEFNAAESLYMSPTVTCNIGILPAISFAKGSVEISKNAKALLDSVADIMYTSVGCNLKITGYGSSDYQSNQECWDRVTGVIEYLKAKGIEASRLIFNYGDDGNVLQVDLSATVDDGPHAVPSPHPSLSKLKKPTNK